MGKSRKKYVSGFLTFVIGLKFCFAFLFIKKKHLPEDFRAFQNFQPSQLKGCWVVAHGLWSWFEATSSCDFKKKTPVKGER